MGKLGRPFELTLALDSVGCADGDGGVICTKSDGKVVEQVPPLALVVTIVVKKARETIIPT